MFNPKYVDFVSSRVKGYQFSPQWYFLLDQASVKSSKAVPHGAS